MQVGPCNDYAWLPGSPKRVLAAGMLLGRLEFSALLVLCLPRFWKP
jgi:Trk-type K+ transport system membrane component